MSTSVQYTDSICIMEGRGILEFLQFLGDWKKLEKKIPVSRSTLLGLKVTL